MSYCFLGTQSDLSGRSEGLKRIWFQIPITLTVYRDKAKNGA